jgi:membrane protein implicated in regulation of membrane protease activity
MDNFASLARIVMIAGALLFAAGALLLLLGKVLPLGRLPGDILWQRGNFSFYFPVVTCIVLSLLLTLLLNFVWRR